MPWAELSDRVRHRHAAIFHRSGWTCSPSSLRREIKKTLKRRASVVTKRYARAKEINGLFARLSNMDWQPEAQNAKSRRP